MIGTIMKMLPVMNKMKDITDNPTQELSEQDFEAVQEYLKVIDEIYNKLDNVYYVQTGKHWRK